MFFFCLVIFLTYKYCFWKIRIDLRRSYESADVLKRIFHSSVPEKDLW